jgi:hypothetical protein
MDRLGIGHWAWLFSLSPPLQTDVMNRVSTRTFCTDAIHHVSSLSTLNDVVEIN